MSSHTWCLDAIKHPHAVIQPIPDGVAQHLEMISKDFRFSTRRARLLMGLVIYYLVLIVTPMGRILVR